MLVFLLTFKSEELEETRSGGSQNPAAERKVQGNYYCFYLFICLEMLPRMSHDMAGCRISAENSSASIKDQQKPHWLLTLCQQPLSDVINPAATARQGTLIFSFSLCCAHIRDWKESQAEMPGNRHRAEALLERSHICRIILAALLCLPCQGAGGSFPAKVTWNPCLP